MKKGIHTKYHCDSKNGVPNGEIHEGKLKNWKMNRHESHTWSEGYKYEGEPRILKKRSF